MVMALGLWLKVALSMQQNIAIVKWVAQEQYPRWILDIISQNPNAPKSNGLHVVIIQVSFVNLRYIL